MKHFSEDIDEKKTISAAKKILNKYRIKMLAVHEDFSPRITSTFSLDVPSRNVETAVVKKVDREREHAEFFLYLSQGLNKLTMKERQIIAMSYLEREPNYDYQIRGELNLSESTFYRWRNFALCKLGIALNVAIYKITESEVEK